MATTVKKGILTRQKLINLMYLVFIALAFLGLQSKFLDSHKYMAAYTDESFKEQNIVLKSKAYVLNNERYSGTNFYQDYIDGKEIYEQCDEIIQYLNKGIEQLENKVGGYHEGYLNKATGSIASKKIFIDGKFSDTLKLMLNAVFTDHSNNFNYRKIFDDFEKSMPLDNEIKSSSGKQKNWKDFFFLKTPNVQALLNLKILKLNLVSLQSKILTYLEANLNYFETGKKVNILSGNSIETAITSKNSYIGDAIEYKVFSKNNLPLQYDSLRIILKRDKEFIKQLNLNSEGMVEFEPSEKGLYKIELYTNDSQLIDVKEVNVLNHKIFDLGTEDEKYYMGVANLLSISSNYNLNNLKFEIEGGQVTKQANQYFAKFSKAGATEVKVYEQVNSSLRLLTVKKVTVSPLPLPDVKISSVNGEFIGSKFLSSLKGLKVNTPLKALSEAYKIRSFYISINGAAPIFNAGSEFSKEAREKIQSAKPGNYIIIEDIKVDGADGDLKQSKSIILKVK